MNFSELTQALREQETECTGAIQEESKTDILIDDFIEDRLINYHLVPPTADWIASKIIWVPSIKGNTEEWSQYIGKYLLMTNQDMLICLNRIIITEEDEENDEAICEIIGVEPCEIPDYYEQCGILWHYASSVIINLTVLKEGARELKDDFLFENESVWLYRQFFLTLLHEIRHLGLDCNPYLPEYENMDELRSEEAVEEWAVEEFEKIYLVD